MLMFFVGYETFIAIFILNFCISETIFYNGPMCECSAIKEDNQFCSILFPFYIRWKGTRGLGLRNKQIYSPVNSKHINMS